MSEELVPQKSKKFQFGFLIGRSLARTEYAGGESFLDPDDDEMMDGYNLGFSSECERLGKNAEDLVAQVDSDRKEEIPGTLTLDVVVQEEQDYYGIIRFTRQENLDQAGGSPVSKVRAKPWDRVELVLIHDDDELAIWPEWSDVTFHKTAMVDDVLRVFLALARPIRSYVKPAMLQ